MRPRTLLLTGAVVAAAIATYAVVAPDGLTRTRALEGERDRLEARVKEARAENAALIAEAKALQDDGSPRVLEQVVREELGHVRDDEVVLILEEEGAPD